MALLRISSAAEVLPGLNDIEGLHLVHSSLEHPSPDRYQISGYGPEAVIPELEGRGCEVEVLMSTEAIEEFHGQIASALGGSPEEPPGPVS